MRSTAGIAGAAEEPDTANKQDIAEKEVLDSTEMKCSRLVLGNPSARQPVRALNNSGTAESLSSARSKGVGPTATGEAGTD